MPHVDDMDDEETRTDADTHSDTGAAPDRARCVLGSGDELGGESAGDDFIALGEAAAVVLARLSRLRGRPARPRGLRSGRAGARAIDGGVTTAEEMGAESAGNCYDGMPGCDGGESIAGAPAAARHPLSLKPQRLPDRAG